MLATVVDWSALGKVVAYSFAATLLLTALFTTGVLFVEADHGRRAGTLRRSAGVLAFGLCAGLVAFGLYVMFTTK